MAYLTFIGRVKMCFLRVRLSGADLVLIISLNGQYLWLATCSNVWCKDITQGQSRMIKLPYIVCVQSFALRTGVTKIYRIDDTVWLFSAFETVLRKLVEV